ncbi:MAG: hypothetical protein HY897_12640 [Deltaproteobacteria bacterium]|nr:hypothetical protein [Deltaproteobacteria bacterium]
MSQDKLEEFLARRRKWIECLNKDDPNSVVRQLYRMNWNATVFAVLNRTRALAPPDPERGRQQSPLIGEFIDSLFQLEQAVAIRRMVDTGGRRRSYLRTDGSFDVYSLGAIITDMKENRRLFTRTVLLAADAAEVGVTTPDVLSSWNRNQINRAVDRMADVSASRRSPVDTVRATVFDCLLGRLARASKKFVTYSDKFIAHAASEESRRRTRADSIRFSIADFWRAHEELCRVANFVSGHFLTGATYSFMPYAHGDQFKYMDRPFVKRSEIPLLHDFWYARQEKVNSWSGIDLDELLGRR